jgi:hypothetical protein
MSPAQQAQLFQPFNRLGREGSQTAGTGIGLVISRHLAELMHGTLEVESRADVGSTFTLVLPAVPLTPRPVRRCPPRRPTRRQPLRRHAQLGVRRGLVALVVGQQFLVQLLAGRRPV